MRFLSLCGDNKAHVAFRQLSVQLFPSFLPPFALFFHSICVSLSYHFFPFSMSSSPWLHSSIYHSLPLFPFPLPLSLSPSASLTPHSLLFFSNPSHSLHPCLLPLPPSIHPSLSLQPLSPLMFP